MAEGADTELPGVETFARLRVSATYSSTEKQQTNLLYCARLHLE